MAGRHLIVVHGRAIKPSGSALAALARRAIGEGLNRAGGARAAADLASGAIRFSSVYYGDINNQLEAAYSARTRALLTAANDPGFAFRPCFPHQELEQAFALTATTRHFNKAAYRAVLEEADDLKFLDEAASFASTLGQLLTFGLLNTVLIASVKSDLTAYLTQQQTTGSAIRRRLQDILEPSLAAGDDICLVTHSLGCMVAYDVFWKYSFRGEYLHMRNPTRPVSLWITLGCPLAEIGVRRNLLEASTVEAERFPRNQFLDWHNVHAEDDYIAHRESMRSAYRMMVSRGHCRSIRDTHIYNCWRYRDRVTNRLTANAHDFYGYLMHDKTGALIAGWA